MYAGLEQCVIGTKCRLRHRLPEKSVNKGWGCVKTIQGVYGRRRVHTDVRDSFPCWDRKDAENVTVRVGGLLIHKLSSQIGATPRFVEHLCANRCCVTPSQRARVMDNLPFCASIGQGKCL